jgi:AraC family transcriptional regulator of adaptative response / DNA-3-methyladenine glycosylase II
LIESGALDNADLEDLATRLGVTSRHLRRLFQEHLGVSPSMVAATQRLHFAKRLISDSSLPMADIALASGFNSVRRFNDAFKASYQRPPRSLRKHATADDEHGLVLRISVRHPYDWQAMLRFFRARAIPFVEDVTAEEYRRSIRIGQSAGYLEASMDQPASALRVRTYGIKAADLLPLTSRLRLLFDTDAPIQDIRKLLTQDATLAAAANLKTIARVPGAFDGFELAVRAILGQQVSVAAATTLAGRVAERYGEALVVDGRAIQCFPRPGVLSRARFNAMGITSARIASIRALSRAVEEGQLILESHAEPLATYDALVALPGIGPWTAEYVVMRVLKHPDAFPSSDLGLLRAFDTVYGRRIKPKELEALAENWRPWRSYAALTLWQHSSGG